MSDRRPILNKEVGARVRMARKRADMTQEAFAEQIGVSIPYISGLESGKYGCSIATLCDICQCLHVSSDYLLFGDPADDIYKRNIYDDLTSEQDRIMKQGIAVLYDALMTQPE